MKALEKAAKIVHHLTTNKESHPPKNIVIASDNTGAIHRIFKGSPGIAQASSLKFRKQILKALDFNKDLHIAITWCPGHFDVEGNERADNLAKCGAHTCPINLSYRSLSIGSVQKCKIREEWRCRWTISQSSLWSNFHVADHIPPTTKPTKRMRTLNQLTFSRTIQCRSGHAHIREYYQGFVPSEDKHCHCKDMLQTREHILFHCRAHRRHCHLLGVGRKCNLEALLGSNKGIRRLGCYIKASRAYDK